MLVLKLLVASTVVFAQSRSNLYTKPTPKVEETKTAVRSLTSEDAKTKRAPVSSALVRRGPGGNLDSEILVPNPGYVAGDTQIVQPTNARGAKSRALRMGDVITATVLESLIAFPDSKAPVRAKVMSGNLKGSIFLGEATLEKNSKRILIEFKKLRIVRSDDDYQLQASVLDPVGILGLEGKYVSKEPKYFLGELVAAGAAGYVDATVERNQNVYGNYVDAPTVDTASKKALGSAMSKTAERFGERIKSAPEYSILEGPIEIQILITEQPSAQN